MPIHLHGNLTQEILCKCKSANLLTLLDPRRDYIYSTSPLHRGYRQINSWVLPSPPSGPCAFRRTPKCQQRLHGNAWYTAEKGATQPGSPFVFWNVSEVDVDNFYVKGPPLWSVNIMNGTNMRLNLSLNLTMSISATSPVAVGMASPLAVWGNI